MAEASIVEREMSGNHASSKAGIKAAPTTHDRGARPARTSRSAATPRARAAANARPRQAGVAEPVTVSGRNHARHQSRMLRLSRSVTTRPRPRRGRRVRRETSTVAHPRLTTAGTRMRDGASQSTGRDILCRRLCEGAASLPRVTTRGRGDRLAAPLDVEAYATLRCVALSVTDAPRAVRDAGPKPNLDPNLKKRCNGGPALGGPARPCVERRRVLGHLHHLH